MKGDSVLLLKVKPGELERAVRDLKRKEEITDVVLVSGPYDLVASGAFRDYRTLRDFVEHIESMPYYQACDGRPSFDSWRRKDVLEPTEEGWTLIKSSTPSRTVRELKRVSNVRRIVLTDGDFNLLVNTRADNGQDLDRLLLEKIHSATGVERAVTLPRVSE